MRRMPCECCQVKKSRKNGFFEPRKNCCNVCRRILCHSCATRQVCRFCTLKESTILEKAQLIKLSEEELVEIAEAFGVSIDSEKLLKCEMVQLIQMTCKSLNGLKSPPGIPKMDPKKLSSIISLAVDTPITTEEKTARFFERSEDVLTVNSFEEQNKHGAVQSTVFDTIVHLPSVTTWKATGSDSSNGKHEGSEDVKKSVVLPPNNREESPRSKLKMLKSKKDIEALSARELRDILNGACVGFEGILEKQELRQLVGDLWDKTEMGDATRQFTRASGSTSIRDITSRNEIKNLSSKELKQILRDEHVDFLGKIEKRDFIELALSLWDSTHGHDQENCSESKTTETGCSTLYHPLLIQEDHFGLAKENSQEQNTISLSEITSSDFLKKLSVVQLKKILKDHSIDCKDLLERRELAYRVLQLWHEQKKKERNEPEVLFEDVNLRGRALDSPNNEYKMHYIKAKKRRGLYVSSNTDHEEARQQEDRVLLKKKKIEDEKKLQEKSKIDLKIDIHASLLPPLRSLSIEDVASPESIKEMSTLELLEILRNHSSNVTAVDEGVRNDRWELAFNVLELWNAEHSLKVQEQLEECKICMESAANCSLLDCGHVVTCYRCAKDLRLCPICRQEVVRIVRLFKA